jgi:hypothetical protein
MMALVVLKNGPPKMMGALSSPPVSTTQNLQVHMSVQLAHRCPLGCPLGSRVIDLQATNAWLYTIKVHHEFSRKLPLA